MDNCQITFVQHGNFAEAFHRFQNGGSETYRDQRASVDFVTSLSDSSPVTVLAIADTPHDQWLRPNLRSLGIPRSRLGPSQIAGLLAALRPRRLICRTPHLGILREARRLRVPTLPCFADIFQNSGLRQRAWNFLLRRELTGDHIPCVANHSLNASRSLADKLGIRRENVVPWDWSRVAPAPEAKTRLLNADRPRAMFAGALSEEKGVGDCLQAVKLLRGRGIDFSMTFAGPGPVEVWRSKATRLGVEGAVNFAGLIPNAEVKKAMAEHDFVVVPSRHSYAEGLPNTIYEGLASRSALILSDHPAFAGRLEPERSCLVFKAQDPASLAAALQRLCADHALYARLSSNAPAALESLYVGLEWQKLVQLFLEDPGNQTGWVERNSLAALGL